MIELEQSKLETLANRPKQAEVVVDQSLPAFRVAKPENFGE
jgi:hypothetical protein